MAYLHALEAARKDGSGYRPSERVELLAELLLRARRRRDQAEDRLELYQSALTGVTSGSRILQALESEIALALEDCDSIAEQIGKLKRKAAA